MPVEGINAKLKIITEIEIRSFNFLSSALSLHCRVILLKNHTGDVTVNHIIRLI